MCTGELALRNEEEGSRCERLVQQIDCFVELLPAIALKAVVRMRFLARL